MFARLNGLGDDDRYACGLLEDGRGLVRGGVDCLT
jgi:hypothetical protein